MTPLAQHIALLTALGWTHRASVADLRYGHAKDWCDLDQVPELTLDLMASAEATLTQAEIGLYESAVHRLVHAADTQLPSDLALFLSQHSFWVMIRATKEQRREAYLRVRGLWVD